MKFYLALLVMGILTQNFVLSKFLGICPFLGVSKKLNTALGMSAAVIFVMLIATAVTYPVNMLLINYDLEFLQTIVFILVIAALVQTVEIVLKKYEPACIFCNNAEGVQNYRGKLVCTECVKKMVENLDQTSNVV